MIGKGATYVGEHGIDSGSSKRINRS